MQAVNICPHVYPYISVRLLFLKIKIKINTLLLLLLFVFYFDRLLIKYGFFENSGREALLFEDENPGAS
jgi:hypothetical protein